ncbi:transcription termination/antitermination protein NusG [Rhizobium lentis]|uniref:transcription termination/antitermination protein NusG n=1 Tax=Rhizobium lentis TaxID=1138194 RepID=UPI001C82BEE5|nr:transcription termination/antitermination NusG family protein [Rhizobium lentis]MBX5015938.1 antitermination protein NusG [Rhizobium lentis]
MMLNKVTMMYNGMEVDVSRALPAMEKTVNRSRITEASLAAASADLVERKPKSAKWYCLQVMTGREIAVENALAAAKVEIVSPRQKCVVIRKGKKIETQRMFFPGYLLVHCVPSPEAFHGLRRVKNVIDIVGGHDRYHVIRNEDVSIFRGMAENPAPRVQTDKTIADGDTVEITGGPFNGFSCVVIAVKWCREARAEVQIDVLGRSFNIKSMPLAFMKKL